MKSMLMLIAISSVCQSLHAEEKPIPADVAASRAGEKATVVFRVESSKSLSDRDDPICFLNSSKNHMAQDNFTVVMFSKALKRFAEAQISNPAEEFYHKTIRVTGEIGLRQGKPQIIVEYVGQIELDSTVGQGS